MMTRAKESAVEKATQRAPTHPLLLRPIKIRRSVYSSLECIHFGKIGCPRQLIAPLYSFSLKAAAAAAAAEAITLGIRPSARQNTALLYTYSTCALDSRV